MSEALLLPGPEKDSCQCGCGLFGTLKRPNRAGVRCVRGCRCKSCLGRRTRRTGQERQRRAQKALGIEGSALGANHEENWRGAVRVEVKSQGFAKPILTKFSLMAAQSEASRPIGDNRPFVAIAEPPGVTWGIVMFRTDKLEETVAALARQMGLL